VKEMKTKRREGYLELAGLWQLACLSMRIWGN